MTSKSIYGCAPTTGTDGRYHYVYRITNLVENKHYYGCRTSTINPYDDLGTKYFSSSKDSLFKKTQKLEPHLFKYKIIKCHESRINCLEHEILLHDKFDVGVNNSFYNRSKQTSSGFDTKDMIPVTDGEKCFIVSKEDPRLLSGDLKHTQVGKVHVKDKTGKTLTVSVDDERYLSGELVSVLSGFVSVKDANGKNYAVKKHDPRLLSGEFVSSSKGTVIVSDADGKVFRVNCNDKRYISGELIPITKGETTVVDSSGKLFRIKIDDPRYKAGMFKHMNAGRELKEETKQKMSLAHKGKQKSQEHLKKIGAARKGKVKAIDISSGKRLFVDPLDDRFSSGAIILGWEFNK